MKHIIFLTILFVTYFFGIAQEKETVLSNGNYLQYVEKLKKETPNFNNLVQLGEILQQTGKIKEAIKAYKNALKIKEDNTVKIKLAESYKADNQRENAIEIYTDVLKNQPENLLLKYRLANLFLQNKAYKKSLDLLSELRKKDSNNITILYKLASVYLQLKEYKKGIFWFKTILNLDSLHYKSHYRLAKTYRKLKNKDSTKFYLEQGLKIKPMDITLNKLQAKNSFQNLEFKKVIQSINRLDSLNVSTPFYQNLLGISYYHTKEYDKAKTTLSKLFIKQKLEDKALYYLGLTHQKLKNYTIAEHFFNMSIYYKRPKIDEELFALAMLYKAQNKPKEAISYLKKSLKERSYNADALYEMAVLTENFYKDKTIALKYYQEYISHFESKNLQRTKYALQQITKIKTDLFLTK